MPERAFATARDALKHAFLALLCAVLALDAVAADEPVRSVRVWPSRDYTRVTIETAVELKPQVSIIKNPDRVVVDLDNTDFSTLVDQIAAKVRADDPYLAAMRAGRFKPGTVRLVLDLKGEINPQVFALKPIGEYGHRLVLDLYPLVPPDPLGSLVQRLESRDAPAGDPSAPSAADAAQRGGEQRAGEPRANEPRTAEQRAADARAAEPRTSERAGEPRAAEGRRAQAGSKPPSNRLYTIVVDAGHGGEDPGALGRGGTHEKTVTLAIAKRVKAMLEVEPNMRVVLTRDGDYFVPLATRVDKARRVRADLFVSIHADAFMLPHARGSSVFALSERGATSAAARWLARRENEADLIGGVNLDGKDRHLAQTLLDLSQTATINDSLKLGRSVLGELGEINTLHKPHVEQAGFAVLKAPDIPSILVETAFISNPEEERRLRSDAYQNQMARAIADGIRRYLAKHPPPPRPTIAAGDPPERGARMRAN